MRSTTDVRWALVFLVCGLLISTLGPGCLCSPTPPASLPAGQGPHFHVVAGATRKVCQLTGEHDGELDQPTHNRTQSRYKVWGTDLGGTFEHHSKLWFVFGDTLANGAWPPTTNPEASSGPGNPLAGDSIAFSTDTDPTDCVSIDFVTHPDGTFYAPDIDRNPAYVQLDGISGGEHMYVWQSASGTALTKSSDDGHSFRKIYDFSKSRFIHLSADVMRAATIPGLEPVGETDWVVMMGNGEWHQTDPYLAVVPLAQLENRNALRFFAGFDGQVPRWSASEDDAAPVFDSESNPEHLLAEGCVGTVDLHYSEVAEAWLGLYDCGLLRLEVRSAEYPWGPWSEAERVFTPDEGGWCHFIHAPPGWPCEAGLPNPGRPGEPGGLYSPHFIERYTSGTRDDLTLYYIVSTWNPYNTFIMTTRLRRSEP